MQCVKKDMRLIKKYDNRKLYDTETSRTVTLKDIAYFIREGQDIKVIDANEKDITNKVLAQVFLQENLQTKQIVLSRYLLEGLIKESNKIEEVSKKLLLAGVGLASLTQEKIDQLVNELVKRGEVEENERSKFAKTLIDKVEKGSKDFKHLVEEIVNEVEKKEKKEDIIIRKENEIAELKMKLAELTEELDNYKKE